jgi:hypothetical protein
VEPERYIEVKSSPTSLLGGGGDEIVQVINTLKELGCRPDKSCAL